MVVDNLRLSWERLVLSHLHADQGDVLPVSLYRPDRARDADGADPWLIDREPEA